MPRLRLAAAVVVPYVVFVLAYAVCFRVRDLPPPPPPPLDEAAPPRPPPRAPRPPIVAAP